MRNIVENFAEVGVTGQIPSDRIADNAVTSDKIADGSINNLKLQDAIIDNDKIEDDGIGAGKIAEAAAPDIVDALESLTGTARLDAYAIRDLGEHALSQLTTHTITVGADAASNEFYGYRQPVGSPLGAFGSADSTAIILGGVTYRLRENWQGENGTVRFSTTPGIPATGDYSQEDLSLIHI